LDTRNNRYRETLALIKAEILFLNLLGFQNLVGLKKDWERIAGSRLLKKENRDKKIKRI